MCSQVSEIDAFFAVHFLSNPSQRLRPNRQRSRVGASGLQW
jgi:hypothetical protein